MCGVCGLCGASVVCSWCVCRVGCVGCVGRAGVEVRKELGLLTASIASIAERCTPELVDEIQMHCWNVSRKRRRNSLFEDEEESMLMQ